MTTIDVLSRQPSQKSCQWPIEIVAWPRSAPVFSLVDEIMSLSGYIAYRTGYAIRPQPQCSVPGVVARVHSSREWLSLIGRLQRRAVRRDLNTHGLCNELHIRMKWLCRPIRPARRLLILSPRQKICSILVKQSLSVNRETQALISTRKRQAIGQLCLDQTEVFGTKNPIGLLENCFEPQAANAQHPFVTSIFSIHLLSMPMMKTTTP